MTHILKTAALAAAMTAGVVGVAQAGEFDGFYVGAYGRNNFSAGTDIAAGAWAGYNMSMGSDVVVGVEGDVEYDWASVWGGAATTGTANVRAGYVATEDVMVYGKAGAGWTNGGTSPSSYVWDVAAGVELQVLDDFSLRGELGYVDPLNAGLASQVNGKVGVGYGF